MKARDLAFDREGGLWATGSTYSPQNGLVRLSNPEDPNGVWELRREWTYAALLAIDTDTVLTTSGFNTYRSLDGGRTFSQVHAGGALEEGGQAIVEGPRSQLFVATNDGAARSQDRGGTWVDAFFDVGQATHWGWAVLPFPDSVAHGRVLVGGLGGVSVAEHADSAWVFRRTALWQGTRYGIEGLGLLVRPSGGWRVLAVGADQTLSHRRAWTSDDLGATWSDSVPLPDIPDGGIGGVSLTSLGGSSAVVVLGRGRVWRTDDAGETWVDVGRLPIDTTAVSAQCAELGHDGRLYVGLMRAGAEAHDAWVYRTAEPVVVPSEPAPAGVLGRLRLVVRPNPSSTTAALKLTLPEQTSVRLAPHVRLTVHDALGRRVATLANGPLTAGTHTFTLDTGALPAGAYLVTARTGEATVSARMTVRGD